MRFFARFFSFSHFSTSSIHRDDLKKDFDFIRFCDKKVTGRKVNPLSTEPLNLLE
jgi:hypothetical protein